MKIIKCFILLHAADVSLCASRLLYVGHMAIYSVGYMAMGLQLTLSLTRGTVR